MQFDKHVLKIVSADTEKVQFIHFIKAFPYSTVLKRKIQFIIIIYKN